MRERIISEFRFVILKPGHGRATFKIDKRPGPRVKDPRLDAINAKYRSNELSLEQAQRQVEELRHSLYKEAKALRIEVHNKDNLRLVDQYWDKEYAHRSLQDPKTARYELDRAIAALGSLSIYSAARTEIQNCVDRRHKGNKQRRIINALRRLLEFAGRHDVRLRKDKPDKNRVKSLSEEEFRRVLKHVPLDAYEILMSVAFYTGARIGECFAMERDDFRENRNEIKILGQLDLAGKSRDTKNRRDRIATVFPAGIRALKKWFDVKHKIKLDARKHMAEVVTVACQKEFTDPRKHLTFHDLRHCYARMCLEEGLDTADVARLIGDSERVAKEHYIGFETNDVVMDKIRRAITRRRRLG